MIILVGASASGKTEVAKMLSCKFNIKKVITHTTRTMRLNEKQDVDYHFVDKNTFQSLKEQNYFVETTFYNDNFYGTSKKEIADNKVLIVDPNGLQAFLALNDERIITFYLYANENTRLQRMLNRGDKKEDALSRIKNDESKFNDDTSKKCHFSIDSEHLDLAQMTEKIYNLYKESLKQL